MSKKVGVLLISLVFIFAFLFLAIADTNSTNSTYTNTSSSSTTSVSQQQNQSKLDTAYACLENKTRGSCSSKSIQEIALTILAVPSSDVLTECQSALQAKEDTNLGCWPSGNCNIKDTSLAILALSSLGQNTDTAQNWLLSKNKTATDLTWFLEQDSNSASQCTIQYSGNTYTVNVGDNKKIDSSAGPCLSLAQSNFWLQISSSCYNTEFQISCDKDFISTLLYKQSNSPAYFVLSDTPSKPAFGTISLKIKAQCFSTNSNCDYESSAWATLALQKTNHDISNYIPYVLALADTNSQFLPNAFIYAITSYEDYGSKLIQQQQLGNFWQADSSAYDKFYDTGLALVSLKSSSSDQVTKAKDWLLFSQGSDGCWQSSVRDTAMVLWALTSRTPTAPTISSTTYCTQANYFCVPTAECSSNQTLPNYFCSGLSSVCCQTESLQNCADYQGKVCDSTKVCTGNTRNALDTTACCLGDCVDQTAATSSCETNGYVCSTSCTPNQEQVASSSCNSGICCRTKITSSSSSLWIWIIIVGIIIVLAIIIFLLRNRVKLWWFKFRKTKNQKPSSSPPSSGMPPRPGFPPIVRPMPPQRMPVRPLPRKDSAMDDTFRKLKEMSK